MKLDESTKLTLTFEELCALVNESAVKVRNGESCDESIQGAVIASVLASLFAVGTIVRADDIKKSVSSTPSATQAQIQAAIDSAGAKTYGGFSAAQATNIVMRTIYQEGKGESPAGRRMIATVIWNRAGGDPNKFAEICLKKSQFSVWNALADRSPKGVNVKVPSGVTSNNQKKAVWNECKSLVQSMFDGSFKPDGDYNAYLNKKTASQSAVNGWGAKMTGQVKVGNHTFGYLREKDGFRRASSATASTSPTSQYVGVYKVKASDRGISFIAKDLISGGKTKYSNVRDLTNEIIRINSFKTDRNGNPIIRPGQEIKIPVA